MDYRSELEISFREALNNNCLNVLYQPQVDMRTEEPKGAEALVRWKKEDGTVLSPAYFVKKKKKMGLTTLLDEAVIGIVCRDICEAKQNGFPFSPVSVNLSRLHAVRRNAAKSFREIAERCGVERPELSFEITETAAQTEDGTEEVSETNEEDKKMMLLAGALKGEGYRIAMDDYGMGSSTLKLLQEVPFDILKLDRYFVRRIGDPRTDIILASTIGMAGALGMEVIAEGVETEKQIRFLLDHRCRYGQGYYYSGPLPKEEYIRWRLEYEKDV